MPEGDWKEDVFDKPPVFKIKDGEVAHFVFKNEGLNSEHKEYGKSIVFNVLVDGETFERAYYVKPNNYDLLNQIKAFGKLTGLHVELSRKGKLRSDTRYTIKKY